MQGAMWSPLVALQGPPCRPTTAKQRPGARPPVVRRFQLVASGQDA
jgi:hypothetical protein